MPRSYLKIDEARDAAEMKYLLASKIRRRKEEIHNYILERRAEIHKRIRYRRHLFLNYRSTRTVNWYFCICLLSISKTVMRRVCILVKTLIYIALYTIQMLSKQLRSNKQENIRINDAD